MKYLNVVLNSTSAFLIITLALFMLSLSSATHNFWQRRQAAVKGQLTTWSTALFCFLAAGQLFSIRQIANSMTDYSVAQQWPLSLLVLILISVPYYFAGLALLSLLNTSWNIKGLFQQNYIFDMLGLMTAVFVPHFFIAALGPEKIMALALLPLIALALFRSPWTARFVLAAALVLSLFILTTTDAAEPMDAMLVKYKKRVLPSQLEYSLWDPVARLDVVNYSEGESDTKFLFYDGGSIGTNIYNFDGDYEDLKKNYPKNPKKYFLRRATVAAHLLKENSDSRAFLFGVGAGQELKAALMYGAKEVYANELVQSVLRLDTGLYSRHNGGIFNDPRVHLKPGDGRQQLAKTAGEFDIIQIFSNYLSSNLASGLAPHMITYLFTEQSIAEYMGRLAPEGILQVNQFGHNRVLNLIKTEWIKTRPFEELKKHIYVIQNKKNGDPLTTVLFKKSEFNAEDERRLNWLFKTTALEQEEDYIFLESPITALTVDSFFHPLNAAAHTQDPLYSSEYATDEKPFFTYNYQSVINNYGLNQLTYLGFIFALMLTTSVYIFRRRPLLRQRPNLYVFYFISGLSFICIQYGLTAQISRFLNSPDLTFPLVLAAFAFSSIMVIPLMKKIKLSVTVVAAIWCIGVLCTLAMPLVLQEMTSVMTDSGICLTAFSVMSLISLLPALTFPVLSKLIRNEDEFNLVWLCNGVGLLVAGLMVHALTLWIGLTALLLTGLTLYLVSFFLIRAEK